MTVGSLIPTVRRNLKSLEEIVPVVEPRGGDNQATASLDGLFLITILRIDLEKQLAHRQWALDLASAAVRAVVGHRRAHPLQAIAGNRSSVIPVDPIDSAHDGFRARLVKTLNRS